jgi:anti-sigma factor RsiW
VSLHVDPIALTSSSGRERRAMLEHLRDCAACREAAAAHDPTILFGLLALNPVPAPLLDTLSRDVARRAGSDRSPYGALVGSASWPRRAAAAAVLMLTLLSGYATLRERPAAKAPVALSSRRADVDVESGRGVSQVIDLTVGETQIVMVYNGDLNL